MKRTYERRISGLVANADSLYAEKVNVFKVLSGYLETDPDIVFFILKSRDSTVVRPERFAFYLHLESFPEGQLLALKNQTVMPVKFPNTRHYEHLILGLNAGSVLYQQRAAGNVVFVFALFSFVFVYAVLFILKRFISSPLKKIIARTALLAAGRTEIKPDSDSSAEFQTINQNLYAVSKRLAELTEQEKEMPARLQEAVKKANAAQKELDAELKKMSALIMLSIHLNKEKSREDLLKNLNREITEHMGFQISLLFLHEKQFLRFHSSRVKDLTVPDKKLREGLTNYLISPESTEYEEMVKGRPYVTSKPHFFKILESNNISASLALFPVATSTQMIAMLAVGYIGGDQRFDAQDLERLTLLGNIIALKIENIEAIDNLSRNVQQRTEELETANKLLAESIIERDNMLKLVSHDLNAPLRNVVGLVDSIHRKYTRELPDDVMDRIERIRNNVDKERRMIKDVLLNFKAFEMGSSDESIDLNDLLSSIQEELQHELDKKSIEFIVQPGLPEIRAKRHLVRHVFLNLVDNASKYLPEGRPDNFIRIEGKESVDEITFSVSDNGAGIPQDKQLDIFLSYKSLQGIRSLEYTGLGLGLALVKNIVEKLSGKIWLKSKPGEGTTFFVSFRKGKFEQFTQK